MKYYYAVFAIFFCVVSCKTPSLEPQFVIPEQINVRVNRDQTPIQAINATGFIQSVDPEVVNGMPQPEFDEVEVYLICFNQDLSPSELDQKVCNLGLKLVDPITLCALNEQNPLLADKYPNATQWRDKNDKTRCALFDRWDGKRKVRVHQLDGGWPDGWFFVCFRKEDTKVSES